MCVCVPVRCVFLWLACLCFCGAFQQQPPKPLYTLAGTMNYSLIRPSTLTTSVSVCFCTRLVFQLTAIVIVIAEWLWRYCCCCCRVLFLLLFSVSASLQVCFYYYFAIILFFTGLTSNKIVSRLTPREVLPPNMVRTFCIMWFYDYHMQVSFRPLCRLTVCGEKYQMAFVFLLQNSLFTKHSTFPLFFPCF